MNIKTDPYATKLHKRIDALLVIFTVVVIAILLGTSARGQTTLPTTLSVIPQPFWTTLNLFQSDPKVSMILVVPSFLGQSQPDYAAAGKVDFSALAGLSGDSKSEFSPMMVVAGERARSRTGAVNVDLGNASKTFSSSSDSGLTTNWSRVEGVGSTIPAYSTGFGTPADVASATASGSSQSQAIAAAIDDSPPYVGEPESVISGSTPQTSTVQQSAAANTNAAPNASAYFVKAATSQSITAQTAGASANGSVAGPDAITAGGSATWSATPTNANWITTTETNWSTGAGMYPGAIGTTTNTDTATFLTSSNLAPTINTSPINILSITFGVSGSTPGAFTIGTTGGNALQLSSGGTISIVSGITGSGITETVNAPLTLLPATATTAGTYTFSNLSSTATNILSFGGAISGGTTTSNVTLTLTGTNTGANTISGVISNGTATGGVVLNKLQGGTWILSGANTYTGGTIWGDAVAGQSAAGVISLGSSSIGGPGSITSGPLGTSTFTVRNNGVAASNFIQSTNSTTRTISNAITLVGSGTLFNFGGTGDLIFDGTVALGSGGRTFTVGNTNTTFSGVISNSGSLTKAGTGTLILSGTNTYTGTTTLSAGILQASNTQALGTSAASLQLNGGTLDLATNTSITAYVTTVGGTATIASDRATSGAGITHTLGTLSIGANTLSLTAGSNVASGTAGLTFGAVTLTGAAIFDTAAGTNLTLGSIGSANGFTKTGAGTLSISPGGVTNSGGITISGGVLAATGASYFGPGGAPEAITINAGTLRYDANYAGTGATDRNAITLGNAASTIDVSGAFSYTPGLVSGSGSLTKAGTGTLTLSSANTYAGNTNLNVGTIALGSSSIVASGLITSGPLGKGTLTIASGTTLRSTAVTTGGDRTISNNLSLGGAITLGDATSTGILTFDNTLLNTKSTVLTADTALTINSGVVIKNVISGSGRSLSKAGAGTLTLSGVNTFSGGFTNSAGFTNLSVNGALGSVTSLTVSGGQVFSGFTNLTDVINDAAAVTLSGGGILDLSSGSETVASLSGVSGTTLIIGKYYINPNSYNGSFTVGDSTNTIFAGVIQDGTTSGTGTTTFTKQGTGMLTLSGANIYTGTSNINAGTIGIGVSNATTVSGALGTSVNVVNLGNTGGAAADAFLLTTGAFTFSNNITVRSGNAGLAVIGGNSANSSTFSGAISLNKDLTITAVTGGTVNLTKSIANASGTDTVNITGAGTSNVVLNNATTNQFAPTAFSINSGKLSLGASNQIADATTLTVAGGTFDLNNKVDTIGALTLNIGTVQSTGGAGTLTTSGVTVTGSGNTISSGATVVGNATFGSGATLTDNGALTGNITMNSGGTLSGSGSVSGTTSVTGGTINGSGLTLTGLVTFNSTGNILSGTETATAGVSLASGASLTQSGTLTGNVTQGTSSALTVNGTVSGSDTMSSGATLSGIGTIGSVSLAGSNTVSSVGTLTTSGLTVNGSGNSISAGTVTGGSTINSGGFLNVASGATLSGTTNVAGTLSGNGTVGILNINGGGKLSPGNSPGTMSSGNTTYNSLGTYVWEINSATGTVGTDPGWDWNDITGTLTINATSGSKFTIDITSLTLGNVGGAAANFNKYGLYDWTISTASGGISGFAADKFTLALGNFVNDITGTASGGMFSITSDGTNLVIHYAGATDTAPGTAYWTGDKLDGLWTTNVAGDTNWATTAAGTTDTHAVPGAASDVFFTATGATNLSNTLGADFSINTLNFTSTAGAVTIGGNTLTLAAGINDASGSTGHTINSAVALGANQTWTNDSANALTVAGVISGGFTLTKAGTGQLTLGGSSANTYSGLTTVSAGTLSLAKTIASTDAVAGDLTISGGTVSYGSSSNEQIADTSNVTLSSGAFDLGTRTETINSLTMSDGTLTRQGGILTLNAASSITGGTLTFTSTTSRITTLSSLALGGANFDLTSGSTSTTGLVLGGDVSYAATNTAATTFTNSGGGLGKINLGGATRTFNIADSNTLGAGTSEVQVGWSVQNGALTKSGTGVLELSNANTYTGATVINAGTLKVDNNGSTTLGLITGSAAANSIQVNSSGTLLLAGSGATNRIANTTGTTLNGGTMAIASGSQEGTAATVTGGTPSGSSATGLGALTLIANSTLNFDSLGDSTLLVFSDFMPGTFVLSITGYANANFDGTLNSGLSTDDRLVFASNQSANLSFFDFGFGGGINVAQIQLDSGFYEVGTSMTPVPEPSTWLAGALALGAVAWTQRRRFQGKIAFAKVA